LINGKEYTKRLRRQFERLYPIPEWIYTSAATKRPHKKRRRASNSSGSSEALASGDDSPVDSGELSAQPLARLLQNAGLTQSVPVDPKHKRKLRPEIIDVQRIKDVGTAQPVSLYSPPQIALLNFCSSNSSHPSPRLLSILRTHSF